MLSLAQALWTLDVFVIQGRVNGVGFICRKLQLMWTWCGSFAHAILCAGVLCANVSQKHQAHTVSVFSATNCTSCSSGHKVCRCRYEMGPNIFNFFYNVQHRSPSREIAVWCVHLLSVGKRQQHCQTIAAPLVGIGKDMMLMCQISHCQPFTAWLICRSSRSMTLKGAFSVQLEWTVCLVGCVDAACMRELASLEAALM